MKHVILAAATILLIQNVNAEAPFESKKENDTNEVSWTRKPQQNNSNSCEKPASRRSCDPCKPVCKPPCPPVCFEPGLESDASCINPAFSAPAAFATDCGWDVFLTASLVYWEAMQGGMDLAVPGQGTVAAGVVTNSALSAVGNKVLETKFQYKPGFQIGLGWEGPKDNWVFYAQYTYLHGTTSTSGTAEAPGVATLNGIAVPQNGIWFPASWFSGAYANFITQTISSKWNYKIDLIDAQMSRPFYSGTRFVLEPFFGLRGSFIRQKMSLSAVNLGNTPLGPVRTASYSSQGNGVGPRAGLNGNWFLGCGFRFIGNASASVLYTTYSVKQNQESPTVGVLPISTKLNSYSALRPNLDMELGFGWGSYFNCRQFYWDLALTYDFNVFWEQNMMRYLADQTASSTVSTNGAPGNLYLQGLTVKTRFDF